MKQLLKRLLDKLEPPANDWVLSRFGGYEGPETAAESDEPLPVSTIARKGSERSFKSWFDEQELLEEASPDSLERGSPGSGEVSSNASTDFSDTNNDVTPTAERKSRVS
jgi:hypothetical protein